MSDEKRTIEDVLTDEDRARIDAERDAYTAEFRELLVDLLDCYVGDVGDTGIATFWMARFDDLQSKK